MKILQIIPTLGSGGAERFVTDLSNELHRRGNQVVLCTLYDIDSKEEYSFFEKELDVSIERKHTGKKLGFDIKLFYRLYQVIKEVNPEVVHTHLSVVNYLILSVLFLWKKVKFVHTLHSDASKLVKNMLEKRIRKFLYKDRVIPVCISKNSRISFERLYGKNYSPRLILNGRAKDSVKNIKNTELDARVLEIKSNHTSLFLTVGRYSKEKNLINLIKAFKNVIAKGRKDIFLMIIGDGDEEIKKELMQYESRQILLLGRKNNVIPYMKMAEVFILPSLFEGMPISLIEAFSQGVIPLVTPVGGMKNMIVHGKTGFFIETPSIENIQAAIESYFKLSPQEKMTIKNEVKKEFETQYTIEICAEKYLNLYTK